MPINNKTFYIMVTALVVMFQSVPFSPVQAEARRDTGATDPLRKAQYIIRQLSQDKSRLEADNGKLNIDLKTKSDKLEKLENKLSKIEKKLDKSKVSNKKLVDRVKQDNERMKTLIEKYKETVTTLRASKSDNLLLVNAVQERNQWMSTCSDKNNKMYAVNIELLQRYRKKGIGDLLAEKELFTGMATVELENEEQEYNFRLEDLQVTRFKMDLN